MAGHVDVRAYAELNDFLGPESHGLTVRRPFRTHQTVKDVLEAMGIPHTEVDLIVVIDLLEPLTRHDYTDFARCTECGRVYWPGSHHARMVKLVERPHDQL